MDTVKKPNSREDSILSEEPGLTRGQRLAAIMRDEREQGKLSLWRARLLTASFKETEGLK